MRIGKEQAWKGKECVRMVASALNYISSTLYPFVGISVGNDDNIFNASLPNDDPKTITMNASGEK